VLQQIRFTLDPGEEAESRGAGEVANTNTDL
jgi:hypothetical protein